jgi:putative addiction module killer protein
MRDNRPRVRGPGRPQSIPSVAATSRCSDTRAYPSQDLAFETGNLGDHKLLGDGVWEARLAFGPGYRLYFGKADTSSCCYCGDKRSQTKDIERAKMYWTNYLKENKHGKTK